MARRAWWINASAEAMRAEVADQQATAVRRDAFGCGHGQEWHTGILYARTLDSLHGCSPLARLISETRVYINLGTGARRQRHRPEPAFGLSAGGPLMGLLVAPLGPGTLAG